MSVNRDIDEVIHAPIRLRICGMLRQVEAIDFAAIKEQLDIQDSSLSKHLKTLADAGYVSIKKESSLSRLDARRITWVNLTRTGKKAFDEYLKTLTAIVEVDVRNGFQKPIT